MNFRTTLLFAAFAGLAGVGPARADLPVIEGATTRPLATGEGTTWTFDVTLRHPDTGPEHYADAWEIVDFEGNVLGTRILGHPHVAEQPFTRSLSGVVLPVGTTEVMLRARCTVDGWSDATYSVTLP